MDKNVLLAVIAGFAGLLGWGLFQRSKKNSAQALNSNLETKEKMLELDKQKKPDTGEEDRKAVLEAIERDIKEVKNAKDLEAWYRNYFNDVNNTDDDGSGNGGNTPS